MAEGAIKCNSCGAETNSQLLKNSISKNQTAVQGLQSDDLSLRLQKAMRRTELLSYGVAGLAIAIFAVIILIHFL
jgi:hypothetical protein